jgi:hypothetical protein
MNNSHLNQQQERLLKSFVASPKTLTPYGLVEAAKALIEARDALGIKLGNALMELKSRCSRDNSVDFVDLCMALPISAEEIGDFIQEAKAEENKT